MTVPHAPARRCSPPPRPSAGVLPGVAVTPAFVLAFVLAFALVWAAPAGTLEAQSATGAERVLTWQTAAQGNEARYRVREQLVRLDFPNDAVGVTPEVRGTLVLTPDGRIDAAGSAFVVGLAALASDNDRRDNYLRRNTLGTDEHPEARFVPREFRGPDAAGIVAGNGESGAEGIRSVQFEVAGDLTIRDVTRQVVWDVEADLAPGSVRGTARTRFTFGDFDLAVPRVGSVLSINDDIRLEYEFHLVP